jgi:hypothetical protein
MTPPLSGPANAAGTQRSGRDTAGAGSGVLGARPLVTVCIVSYSL